MLKRVCDRCGREEMAKPVSAKMHFRKFGTGEDVSLSMSMDFTGSDLCGACADWFIKEAKWK